MDGVLLSAHRGDIDQQHRIRRLADVYVYAITNAVKVDGVETMGEALLRLHDHKGSLTALWSCRASAVIHAATIDQAWAAQSEYLTTHVCAEEGIVLSGDDTTWEQWIWDGVDILADLPSPSDAYH